MRISSIEALQLVANTRGGKCLSRVYVSSTDKLLWRCNKGHEWKAVPNSIQQGSWCPKCAGHGKTILEMQHAARLRDGKCLSKTYKGVFVKLQWQCANGHEFKATPTHVINHGSWCPKCYLSTKKLKPKERRKKLLAMKELARLKNGYCLSTQYVNGQTPLLWRCQNGHEWLAVPESIKNAGTWCASCASGVSERICRAVLEKMFRCTFYKKKPKWLQTARNTLMELDGYSEEFNIAFEYHGIQHFLRNIRFHSETATLERRLADDRRKVALCRQHGIILLQIPYTVPHIEFENYIRKLLRPHNKNPHVNEVLTRITDDRIDLSTLNAYSPASLLEMQQLANKRGGQCLSKIYVNNRTKLRWRCKFGHFWEASPVAVRRGRWCHKCGGFLPHTLADMRLLAHKRGGECLATKYAGRKTKISWRCAKGHIWQTTPGGVIAGAWCPYCANRPPITIEDVQALAKTRRGECLSTRYVNSQTKLRFRCVEGHEWETIWNRLQQGMWCPACGRRKACNKRRSPPHDPNAQHTAR